MSLRFIFGRAGSGKSNFCFQDIKSKIESREDTPLILIVPDDYSFQAEKDLLSVIGEKGLMKANVFSFKRMAYKVFSEVGGLISKHMNNSGKCILLYKIMDELKDEFLIYKKAVKMNGFVNIISEIITELKMYGVDTQKLLQAQNSIDDDILKSKLHDINIIYKKFDEYLHKGYIDPEDELDMLVQKLDTCDMFKGAEIWVDGFSMFTPIQYKILEKLLKKSKRVNITLCMDCSGKQFADRIDVFLPIKKIEDRMLKIAKENNIPFEKPVELKCDIPYKYRNNNELAHLEKYFFSFPYKIYEDTTKYVSIFKAKNKYSEVEYVARDIIRMCRDENFRFGDIAVVTKDIKEYENLVNAIFSEHDIPYFFDHKKDISSNPLIVMIISAMEILCNNWNYESVFKYLKTGLTKIGIEDIDLIENYVLAAGIKGKRWTDDKPWQYWPDYGFEDDLPENIQEKLRRINTIRNAIREPLLKFKSDIDSNKNTKHLCNAIFEFICNAGVSNKIDEIIKEMKDCGQLELASEYSRIWNILLETLDQIANVLGDEYLSLEQFLKIFSTGIGEYKLSFIPPALDQVVFGDIEKIKSHNVKILYVIGVNDGIFPSTHIDEGLLNDNDREILKSIGIELAPSKKDQIFDEQYLIYTTFTRTDKYLKISYPISDHEGRALRPSIIISRLKKVFKNIVEHSNIIEEDTDEVNLSKVNSPMSTFNELVRVIRKNADGLGSNPVWKDVYFWYMNNDKWKDRLTKVLSGISYTNQVKPLNTEKLIELYGKNIKMSISRLEKYAQCPFAYFMQYGLKAKERKIYELSSLDIGSFMHIVLDKFSSYLDEKDIKWRELDREQCKYIISILVDETADKMVGSILLSSAKYKYLKERLKRIIFRAIWLITLHIKRGGFEPVEHEVSFDKQGKYPPIEINLPSGQKVNLIGRIDRVDMFENEEGIYVRVIDYKSGKKDFSLSDIYNGLELQLLIYIDAILEHASKKYNKPVFPGGVLYFHLDEPIIPAESELSEEDAEKELMKMLKMKGLLLEDVKVIREMDRDMNGYSLIIPANIKADGSIGLNSSVASADDFIALRKHVKKCIINLCEDMFKGNIDIRPYKNKNNTPCSYCSFKPVCEFDVNIKENSYRIISNRNKDEIFKSLRQEMLQEGGNTDGLDA